MTTTEARDQETTYKDKCIEQLAKEYETISVFSCDSVAKKGDILSKMLLAISTEV